MKPQIALLPHRIVLTVGIVEISFSAGNGRVDFVINGEEGWTVSALSLGEIVARRSACPALQDVFGEDETFELIEDGYLEEAVKRIEAALLRPAAVAALN